MTSERRLKITEEISTQPSTVNDDNAALFPYAGPVAELIARLEARITELETIATDQRFEDLSGRIAKLASKASAGPSGKHAILSLSDVAELIRASR
jgi:hypothetical protein